MLAVEGCFLLRPKGLHRKNALAHDIAPVLEGNSVVREFLLIPAKAYPQHGSSARKQIEGGDFFGQHDRIALSDESYPSAESYRLRHGCSGTERHERI